jgi:hypothetical protein
VKFSFTNFSSLQIISCEDDKNDSATWTIYRPCFLDLHIFLKHEISSSAQHRNSSPVCYLIFKSKSRNYMSLIRTARMPPCGVTNWQMLPVCALTEIGCLRPDNSDTAHGKITEREREREAPSVAQYLCDMCVLICAANETQTPVRAPGRPAGFI